MVRLAKLTDYGIVLLTYMARDAEAAHNARELAQAARLPLPTVSKVLKALSRGGLLVSRRGVHGGYGLARDAKTISITDVINAIEGRVAMTECSDASPGLCDLEACCPISANWRLINQVVVDALGKLSLADMARPLTRSDEQVLHLVRKEAAQ